MDVLLLPVWSVLSDPATWPLLVAVVFIARLGVAMGEAS